MSKYRRAAKVDGNQKEIVEGLRKLGYSVELGHDDILVGRGGRTYWYEIKNPKGKNKKQPGQEDLERQYKGHYKIVRSIDEILLDILGQQ